MIDNSQNPKLQVAYQDPQNEKITFYCLKNPLDLPAMRGVHALKAKRFADLKIDVDSMKELMKKIKTAINVKQDFVEAMGWWQQIEFRLEMITEERSLLDLVCLYYYLPDEDPEVPSAEATKKKMKIFEDHPKIKGFFLRIAINMMNNFSMQHDEAVLSYLKETEQMAEILRQMLEENPKESAP